MHNRSPTKADNGDRGRPKNKWADKNHGVDLARRVSQQPKHSSTTIIYVCMYVRTYICMYIHIFIYLRVEWRGEKGLGAGGGGTTGTVFISSSCQAANGIVSQNRVSNQNRCVGLLGQSQSLLSLFPPYTQRKLLYSCG